MLKELEKEIVRIFTDGYEDNGDFVKCVDCGELQLIQVSKKTCQKCDSINLMWVNDEIQISNPDQIEELGYEIEFVI